MLPKINRLNREEFPLILKTGRRSRGKCLSLLYIDKKSNEPSKMGIVLTKKAFKGAVARNKAKRQIRSVLVEEVLPRIGKGFTGIIMVYGGFSDMKFAEIKEEIKRLFGL